MLGVDVSGSMYTDVLGSDAITAAAASAAMAMVTLKSEQTVYCKGFSDHLVDLRINKEMTLREVMGRIREVSRWKWKLNPYGVLILVQVCAAHIHGFLCPELL